MRSAPSSLHCQVMSIISDCIMSPHKRAFQTVVLALLYASWPIFLPGVLTWLPTNVELIRKFISMRLIYSRSWWLQFYRKRQAYDTYQTAEDEERYWQSAALHRRRLASSNARDVDAVAMYYSPRLLPLYRSPQTLEPEASEYNLSTKTFCKWHRMVFPGRSHPNMQQAVTRIKAFSSRDRREIYRISRMLTDEEVFQGGAPCTQKYRKLWTKWLDTKGPDIAIVFE